MAKRKPKTQATEAQEAQKAVETPAVQAETPKAVETQTPPSYKEMVDTLVCSLSNIATRDTQKTLIKRVEDALLQSESDIAVSAINCAMIELSSPQPNEVKWGVVINIIRDALIKK